MVAIPTMAFWFNGSQPGARWLTWFAGDWLQWQGHLGVRGDLEGLSVGVESRDHHVGHVHLLGQKQYKHTLQRSSCLICLKHRFLQWELCSNAIAAGCGVWRRKGLERRWPGSAAEAGWSCAAAGSAAAAVWRSETKNMHVCMRKLKNVHKEWNWSRSPFRPQEPF